MGRFLQDPKTADYSYTKGGRMGCWTMDKKRGYPTENRSGVRKNRYGAMKKLRGDEEIGAIGRRS